MVGVFELVHVLSGDQWLVCASWLLFCQEVNGWCVCDMVAVLSVGQWLACEMIALAYGWRVHELVAVLESPFQIPASFLLSAFC